MRIQKITLTNFRSFKKAVIDKVARINYFGGLNRSGKSTLADALAICMSGSCRGVDRGGRGASELRYAPNGERAKRKWQVKLLVENPTNRNAESVEMTRKEGEGPRSEAQIYIERFVQLPQHMVRACVYSNEVLELADKNPREAQRLLIDMATPRNRVEISDSDGALLQKVLELDGAPKSLELTELEEVHQMLCERRLQAHREAQLYKTKLPPLPAELAAWEHLTLEALQDAASKIEQKLGELRQQQRRESAKTGFDAGKLTKQLTQLKSQHPEDVAAFLAPSKSVAEAIDRVIAEQVVWVKEEAELRPQYEAAKDLMTTASNEVEFYQTQVNTVEELQGNDKCPTCMQLVPQAYKSHIVGKLKDHLDAAKRRFEARTASFKKEGERYEPYVHQPDWEQKCEELRELEARQREIDKLEAEISKLDQTADEPQVEGSNYAERIAVGERRLEFAKERIGALKTMAELESAAGEAKASHKELDELVEKFGPTGYKSKLAGESQVTEFVQFVSETLGKFGFGQTDLTGLMSPGQPLLVDGRHISLLSESERLLLGIAIQIAAARWSGLGIVVIDRFEVLDQNHARTAQKLLKDCGEQVFIFAVLRTEAKEFLAKAKAANKSGFFSIYYLAKSTTDSSVVRP
ncbi:MAG: AAA family ATPase [Planctomycetota bacterium]